MSLIQKMGFLPTLTYRVNTPCNQLNTLVPLMVAIEHFPQKKGIFSYLHPPVPDRVDGGQDHYFVDS